MMRIGIGEDLHVLVEGRPLILAGVRIPYEKGLLGHSDGDVVYHALADALLGSIAKGDIGHLFPPEDPTIEGIDSALILKKAASLVAEEGYHINNVDLVITAERPKLKNHLEAMKQNIAAILGIDCDQVGIQAKTNEGCDALGEGKAIRVSAACLIER